MTATVTSKGQVTIPKDVREHLGVGAGGKVKFFKLPDGRVYVLPVKPIASLRGILKGKAKRKTPVSIGEMNEAVAKAAVERFKRSGK